MNVATLRGTISKNKTNLVTRPWIEKRQYTEAEKTFVACRVHTLPLSEFLIAHLHFWRGYSLAEISESYYMPYPKVVRLRNQAVWRLRRMYKKRFGHRKFRQGKQAGFLTL